MKKILFIASTILILLSGCENFLDSELLTEKTTANFPETEKGCPRDGDGHIRPSVV